MSTLLASSARWLHAFGAGALILVAAMSSSDSSWLFVILGIALLFKACADALDKDGDHKRAIAVAYVAIIALVPVAYLVVSSR